MNQEQVRAELGAMMEQQKVSLNAISKAVGISTSAISQWLAGKYAGDSAKVAEAISQFLQRSRERKQQPKRSIGFITTSAVRKYWEAAKLCHLDGEIGIVSGDAGLGKTEAASEYARRNSDVILIEVDLGYTARVLFRELHRKLGGDGNGGISDLKDDVIKKLRKSGRLIIVDEAEHLPYRALELLRRLNDKAGVGLLLAGMPRLINNLRGKKGEYAQLYSRVGVHVRLLPLTQHDADEIVKSLLPDASAAVCKAYYEASTGNTRVLAKLLMRSLRVAEINSAKITPELVHETVKMLII
ncbi:MAG: AAA family ATPase [Pseudomonadota bacterium]